MLSVLAGRGMADQGYSELSGSFLSPEFACQPPITFRKCCPIRRMCSARSTLAFVAARDGKALQ
jgi:hypothetical protein